MLLKLNGAQKQIFIFGNIQLRSHFVAVETRHQLTTQLHYNTKQTVYLSTVTSTSSVKLSEKT